MWNWFSRLAPKHRTNRSRSGFRPYLEVLEDRCCPSGGKPDWSDPTGGALDPTFGSGGLVTSSFSSAGEQANSLVIQPDGKIVAAGYTRTGTGSDFLVARYNPDGSLDSSFGTGGDTSTDFARGDDAAEAVALQPNTGGKILVAGYAHEKHTNADFALARYTANGTLDTTFGNNGKVVTDFAGSADGVEGMAVQSDGKIVVAGNATTASGIYLALARYNANGSLDTTFGSGGKVLTTIPIPGGGRAAVTIQGDGKIVVVRGTTLGGTNSNFVAARFNGDGTPDTGFGSKGQVVTDVAGASIDYASGVALQTDGKIVAVGTAVVNNVEQFATVRYNTDGTLDAGFGQGGEVLTSVGPYGGSDATCVAIQSDGEILVGGHAADATGTAYNFALARYNPDGSLDANYGGAGTGTLTLVGINATALAMAIQSDGKAVLVGNAAESTTGLSEVALARYLPSAPQISSFTANPNPVVSGSDVTLTVSNITDGNPNSTITQVAIYLDSDNDGTLDPSTDTLLGYAIETSPGVWTLTFSTSAMGLTAGTYELFAQAQDNYGAYGNIVSLELQLL
ncbi:MAG TPA: delta-60 repeat domain-containing protein [Gemmataceae bacterium]|nr:delta-60 repeat domain-containing protein [Gemmataceae bacterium]